MKSTHYRILCRDNSGFAINELQEDYVNYIQTNVGPDSTKRLTIAGKNGRAIRLSNASHELVGWTEDSDLIASKSKMEAEARLFLAAAENIALGIKQAKERASGHAVRLIHNLKTLTAKTTQEIYLFADQQHLMQPQARSLEYLESEFKRQPAEAAKMLLKVLKHQAAQKAEYSAFLKLDGRPKELKQDTHSIHRVLMNVFYLFFGDFSARGINAPVAPTDLSGFFDYDSIHAALFHIVDNARKYAREGSKIDTVTCAEGSFIEISFTMESCLIYQDEIDQIMTEGYSGRAAKQYKLHGDGIGLFIADQLIRQNGGRLHVINGKASQQGQDWARNRFLVILPTPDRKKRPTSPQ